MEEILNCFLKDDNPDMTRQIQFIIQQLNSGNSIDDAISSVICVPFNTCTYHDTKLIKLLLNLLYLFNPNLCDQNNYDILQNSLNTFTYVLNILGKECASHH